MGLLRALKSIAVSAVDPKRQIRAREFALDIETSLRSTGARFNFDAACIHLGIADDERPNVASLVYGAFLDRAWKDGLVNEKVRSHLSAIAKILDIDEKTVANIERDRVKEVARAMLARGFADGQISAAEAHRLERVAVAGGTTVAHLMTECLATEGKQFIQAAFREAASDGTITEDEWVRLVASAERLQLQRGVFLSAISTPARDLVTHTFADATSDQMISPEESKSIRWLLANLPLEARYRDYVESELATLETLTRVREGGMNPLPMCSIELRAGELAYFEGQVVIRTFRTTTKGRIITDRSGTLTITDSRIAFTSLERGWSMALTSIVKPQWAEDGFIISGGKATGWYRVGDQTRLCFAVLCGLLGRINQRIVNSDRSRHVPRDVRQRVWQRYGGRCADCESDMYLEFDHIVPVAKGGNNSDNNIQLLCRGCNSKKSDMI